MSSNNPLKWSTPTWRRFFVVAAGWNLIGGIPAALFPNLNLRMFYGFQSADYHMLFLNRGFWISVILLGVGYLIASTDPRRHAGILLLGMLGKFAVAFAWIGMHASGHATRLAWMAGWGDLLFAAFFLLFLVHGQKQTVIGRFRKGEAYADCADQKKVGYAQ